MEKMQLGTSDLQVSRLSYGCMLIGGFWDRTPLSAETQADALKAVEAALDQGIDFFDHADIYCLGKSESAFTPLWKKHPYLRQKIYLQTKCGIRFAGDPDPVSPDRYDFSYAHITNSVEGSLRRLGTDYIDVLLLHRPDPLVEPEEVARAFDTLHASGKVRWFGVSNHTAAQIELLRSAVQQPLVANQVELNPLHSLLIDAGVTFNQDLPPQPLRNEGTLEYCRQHRITLQAWSPLANGYLTGREPAKPSATITAASAVVAELAKAKGVPGEAILVAWLLAHPARIQPVIGTTRPERIRATCQGAGVQLSREDWYRLFTAGRGAPLP